MKVLAANLKHFYQCRGLWYFYLILSFPLLMLVAFPLMMRERGVNIVLEATLEGRGGIIAFASLFIGVMVSDLQRNILSKPFSFCMPRHRGFPRAFIFGLGATISLLLGVLFFGFSEFESPRLVSVVLAASFVGMIAFLLSVCAVFSTRSLVFFSSIWIFFIVGRLFNLNNLLAYMVVSTPCSRLHLGF